MTTRSEYLEQFLQNRQKKERKITDRWDHLHDYERVKRARLVEKRRVLELSREEELMAGCTFTPKLNKMRTKTTDLKLQERVKFFEQKKNNNLDKFQKEKEEKEYRQCLFQPIVYSTTNTEHNVSTSESVHNVVHNPTYNNYLRRINDMKVMKQERINKEDQKPGSGKLWKNGITVPKSFNLGIRKELNRSATVKSLNKPINPNLSTNNSQSRIRYLPTAYEDVEKIVYSERKETVSDIQDDYRRGEGIRIAKPMEYSQALKYLHEELNSMSL